MSDDHATYLGTAPCGCATLAISTYGMADKQIRRELSRHLRKGYKLERLAADVVRKRMVWDCPHGGPPPSAADVVARVEELMP